MKRSVFPILALSLALAAASAAAQPAPAASTPGAQPGTGMGPGMGRGPGGGMGPGMGRGPGGGMGPGAGPGMGPGMGRGPGGGMARWGDGVTPGWSLMTPEERLEHQDRMRAMTNVDECRAYVRRHHAEMAARALSRGQTIPPSPRRDLCAVLQR